MSSRMFLVMAVLTLGFVVSCEKNGAEQSGVAPQSRGNDVSSETAVAKDQASETSVSQVAYVPVKGAPGFTTETVTPSNLVVLPYNGVKVHAEGAIKFDNGLTINKLEFTIEGKRARLLLYGIMDKALSDEYFLEPVLIQSGRFYQNMSHKFAPKTEDLGKADEDGSEDNANTEAAVSGTKFIDDVALYLPDSFKPGSLDGILIVLRDKNVTDNSRKFVGVNETTIGFIDHYWRNKEKSESNAIFWPFAKSVE